MAGMFDSLFGDPSSQAMWALGSGLLGVRRGNEGRAFMGAMGAYNDAQQEQRRNSLVDIQKQHAEMQLTEAKRKQKADEAMRSLFANPAILKPGRPAIQGNEMDIGQPEQPASIDQKRLIQTMIQSGNPVLIQKAMELQAKAGPIKLGKGDQLLDPETYRPIATNTDLTEKSLPAAIQEYQFAQSQGYKGTFDEWDKERKRAGASSVNVGLQSPYAGVDSQGNPIVVQPANRPGVSPQVLTGPDGKPIRPTPNARDPQGQTPENAGKVSLMERGVANIDMVDKALIVRDASGKAVRLNRALVTNLNSPISIGGEARSMRTAIRNAVEAKLRLETGAAATEPEIQRVADRFMPTPLDTVESAEFKLKELRSFFSGALEMTKGAPERTGGGKTVNFKDLK